GPVAGLELRARGLLLDFEDLVADFDALVADADLAGSGDQIAHLAPALGAEGAETIVGAPLLGGHGRCSLTLAIISSGNPFGIAEFLAGGPGRVRAIRESGTPRGATGPPSPPCPRRPWRAR